MARPPGLLARAALLAVLASVVVGACGHSGGSGGSGRSEAGATSSTTSAPPSSGGGEPQPGAGGSSTTTTAGGGDRSGPDEHGPPRSAPTIVAAGDIACAPGTEASSAQCRQATTSDLALSLHPDAVIVAGDLQYDSGTKAAFDASYAPTWGRLRDVTHPAPGNHEYGTKGAAGYFAYWGDRAGPAGKGWYSWDLGGWHLVALNSNCSVVGCGEGSEQLGWLRADLARSTAPCTLAYWHHPRFSSGLHGDDTSVEPLWQALVAAHADVVVSGHDHHYERFAPTEGLRQFVAGTGGRSLYPVFRREPGSEAVAEEFGVLQLTLDAGGYSWAFHDLAGGVADSGTAHCG